MTDRDTQTNLALARMMGDSVNVMLIDDIGQRVPGRRRIVDLQPTDEIDFDAIYDGAAFDKVLMWALQMPSLGVAMTWNDVAISDANGRVVYHKSFQIESVTELRRFVCEAIVEAGDDLL